MRELSVQPALHGQRVSLPAIRIGRSRQVDSHTARGAIRSVGRPGKCLNCTDSERLPAGDRYSPWPAFGSGTVWARRQTEHLQIRSDWQSSWARGRPQRSVRAVRAGQGRFGWAGCCTSLLYGLGAGLETTASDHGPPNVAAPAGAATPERSRGLRCSAPKARFALRPGTHRLASQHARAATASILAKVT